MRILKYTFVAILLGFVSCALLKSVREVVAVKDVKLSLSRVEVIGVDFNGIKTMLYFDAKNPNDVDAKIVSFDFDVLVNSEKIAKGKLERVLVIPARGVKNVKIPVYIPFSGISMSTKKVLLNKSAEIGIKGYALMNTALGSLRFKVLDRTRRIF